MCNDVSDVLPIAPNNPLLVCSFLVLFSDPYYLGRHHGRK
jgi:hypothetical protein